MTTDNVVDSHAVIKWLDDIPRSRCFTNTLLHAVISSTEHRGVSIEEAEVVCGELRAFVAQVWLYGLVMKGYMSVMIDEKEVRYKLNDKGRRFAESSKGQGCTLPGESGTNPSVNGG